MTVEVKRRYNDAHTKLGQLYLKRIDAVRALKKLDAEIEKAHEDVMRQLRTYESGVRND